MSKESVNRPVVALALLFGIFLGAPARAQVALVTGSVRDQHGAAISGASVEATTSAGRAAAVTDASGTFALSGAGILEVTIGCRFCMTVRARVTPGEPVVAILRRFDALVDRSPSDADLAALPYDRVESGIALRPFTLLRQTTRFFPGSQLSDRGLEPDNALLIDAGVPDYDVVFGNSPYETIPAHYEQSATVLSASNAFLYGDQAGSGIVDLAPFGGNNASVALIGGDSVVRATAGSDGTRLAAGTYSNSQESRQRADGEALLPLSTAESISVNAGTSQGRQYGNPGYRIASDFSFANATFDDVQPSIDTHASFSYDRGAYQAFYDDRPQSNVWSDATLVAGMRTLGTLQFFADASLRSSTGIYDAQSFGHPVIGASLDQNRLDLGVTTASHWYQATAGLGVFGFGYEGGSGGVSTPSYGRLALPSVQLTILPQSRWSASWETSDSFDLPTLWQQFTFGDNYGYLAYNRARLYGGSISYTDDARLRVTLEEATQQIHGFVNGQITSTGAAVAWQFAPALSLRAWTMLASDGTAPSRQIPYSADGVQPSVNAMWLTYDNLGAVRADAVYRKDLLNGAPFYHFDGDLSGPIAGGLRWYAGVEDRLRTTRVDAGLQFTP